VSDADSVNATAGWRCRGAGEQIQAAHDSGRGWDTPFQNHVKRP
jgi:hypothetical protein